MAAARERIPVILDTDIGTDVDDLLALAMLLRTPRLTFAPSPRSMRMRHFARASSRPCLPSPAGSTFRSAVASIGRWSCAARTAGRAGKVKASWASTSRPSRCPTPST